MNRLIEVTDYISKADNEQSEILQSLRNLIESCTPNAEEGFKWGRPVYKLNKDFCYLQATKNGVNLGFFSFNQIEDPNHLLVGTGSKMRHIKLSTQSALDTEVLSKMIKQAAS